MKEAKRNLEDQRRKNQNWYNRRYNEDATQRADAQAILTRTEEEIRNRNRQAAGVRAVMGGSEESVAATKAANNKALSDAVTNIVVNGEARKDAIESQYLQTDANLQQQLNAMEQNKAQAIAAATKGVGEAAGYIADLDFGWKKSDVKK